MCDANKDLILKWMRWTPDAQAPSPVVESTHPETRNDEEEKTIQVARGERFLYTLDSRTGTELLIGRGQTPAEGDLRLRWTEGRVALWFEGRWMVLGNAGATENAVGKVFQLQGTRSEDGCLILEFTHRLQPGDPAAIYHREKDAWVRRARIICNE